MADPHVGTGAGAAPEPLVDPAALATVASLQRPGAPDLVARVLRLFAEDAPRRVAEIAEGVAAFDAETVRTAAHTLKSSAANVGATRLSSRCALIERAARELNLAGCMALADALGTLLDDTLEALERSEGEARGPATGTRAA